MIILPIHINSAEFGGKIIYQDDKITVVPCVLMAEGVQNNGLKQFEEFYDPNGLEGALWFEGVPIVREHPPHHVTHKTLKIGRIRNVEPDIEARRVKAEAVLFNSCLTPDELKAIESGKPMGGSIGYWSEREPVAEPQIWTDGIAYDHIEKAPFFGDHFALTAEPACPVGVCGFNVNSDHNDCNCPKKIMEEIKLTTEPEPGSAAEKQPVIDEKEQTGDPKPPEGNAQTKQPEGIATEDATSSVLESKTVMEMNSKILDSINALSVKIDSQNKEIEALKADKQAREAAIKAEQDELTKNSLKVNFDQAYQMEFDKHWAEIQTNGINTFLANPEHAKHWDVKGDRKQISPVGAAFVQHDSSSEEAEYRALGVPSFEDLSLKLGGKRA